MIAHESDLDIRLTGIDRRRPIKIGNLLSAPECVLAYLFNKLVRSTLWRTVSAASEAALAKALPSGDTQANVNSTARIVIAQAAQPSDEEEQTPPCKQATAQWQ